jgi:hypothetical protein
VTNSITRGIKIISREVKTKKRERETNSHIIETLKKENMTHTRKFKSNKRRGAAHPAKKRGKSGKKFLALTKKQQQCIILLAALAASGKIPASVLEHVRWWHGNIDQQFANIKGLYILLMNNLSTWPVPIAIRERLGEFVTGLETLIAKCRSNEGSAADRAHRNTLLKSAVGYCLMDVKAWAYEQFAEGVLTVDNVHEMNFLLPSDFGGHHDRAEPTDVIAETKAKVLNADFIDGIVDQATDKNAGPVRHGWPRGIRQAILLLLEADGKTEVLRKMTTHLHNEIKMPEGSHGKQFMLAAAFLKHVDDEPKFGEFTFFSMPKTAADLAAILDQQHHDEFEEHVRVVEQHRQDVERIHAEQNALKD